MVERAPSAILTYHSLDASGAVTSLHPDLFRRQMDWLAASGTPVLALDRIRGSSNALALTFDDGYRNFLDCALPVLASRRFPATIFVIGSETGADARRLDWPALRELAAAGIEIGVHCTHHVDLSRLPADEAINDLRACRLTLEDQLGIAVRSCAYPFGASAPALRDWARRYFHLACGTDLRFLSAADDPADLPRLDTYYLQSLWLFRRIFQHPGRAWLAARRSLRILRSHWRPPGIGLS